MKTASPAIVFLVSSLLAAQAQLALQTNTVVSTLAAAPAQLATPGTAAVSNALAPPVLSAPARAVATPPVVVERGPHHAAWARITYQTNRLGKVFARTNAAFTELASGLNRFDSVTKQWIESQEVIEAVPGGAVARQGQHTVAFA